MNTTLPAPYHLSKVASILKISRPLVLKMAKSGELPCDRTPLAEKLAAFCVTDHRCPHTDRNP